ncbi:hypothetical protein SAMN02745166_01518 [Prosthecobacter debontii]|uniref:Uncharacterized protein n=1 Tax=Prosthecobacter debontii TaxID=48467 RepID=A0A1T4XHK4_9BACT|nr:hypothetical protein SAMN02745166_01518 [Prosthecobacter debontii]
MKPGQVLHHWPGFLLSLWYENDATPTMKHNHDPPYSVLRPDYRHNRLQLDLH